MIPKIIHFCWLSGDSYPDKIKYCIDSWQKNLPDYEVILWDLNKFDISQSQWVKQAFEAKKYAFAADYIRCYALYHYGGIYLDSDVEVVKTFNDLLDLPYFIGVDCSDALEPAIMGFEKGNKLFSDMLHYYDSNEFILNDGNLNVVPLPHVMREIALKNLSFNRISSSSEYDHNPSVLNLYPCTYFSPKRQDNFKIINSRDTYTIHHFNGAWYSKKQLLFRYVSKLLGHNLAVKLSRLLKKII